MDCDDDDNSHHNLQLTGDSRSKSSVVLRPYDFPKFDFDDSLQTHLRFDTLVETEVFLGIQSQEDNQWIEDFSRGTNGMEFNSTPGDSCPISKRNNVWSEATSSESVEMLLKSVGQEEMIPGESSISESNVCRDPSTLANCVEPGSKLDAEEGENHANSEIKSLLLDKHVEEQFPDTEEPPIVRENLESTSGENVTSSNEGRHPCHDENVKEFNVYAENLAISKAGDDSINFTGNNDSDFGMFSTTEVSEQVANVSFEGPNGNEQSNEQEESKISEVKRSEASVSVHNAGSSVGLVGESGVLKRHDTVIGGCVEEDIADRITDDGYDLKISEVNGQSKSSKIPIQMGKDEVEVEVLPTNIDMSVSFGVCRDESAIGGFDQHHAEIGSQNAEQFVVSKQIKDAFMPVNFKDDIDNTKEAQISASKGENTCEMPWVSGDNNKSLLDSHDDVDVANVDKSSEMLVLSSSIESTCGENKADIIVHCHDDSSKSEEKSATQLSAAVLDGSRHVSVSESELDICETSKDKELPTDVENVNLENAEMPLPSNDWINPSPVVGDGIEEKVVVLCMEIVSSVEDGEPEIAKSEPAVVRLSPTDNRPEEIAPEISSDVNVETEVVNAVEDEVTATGGTVKALLSETIVKPPETSVENDVRNNTESHSAEAIICLNLNNSQEKSSLKESVGTDLVSCGHQEETAMKVERDKEPEQCAVTEKASCGSPTIISSSEPSQMEKDGHEDVRGTEAGNQFVKAQTFSEVPKRKDATGDDSTFTFKVDALPDITEREPGKTWSPLLNAEKSNSPVVVVEMKPLGEGKSARTPKQKTPHQNARTSTGEHEHGTPKGTSERKGRRASAAKGTAKEKVKKGNKISDVNTEGAKVDKVSSSGIHVQSEKRQLCKRIEQSKTILCGASAVPDLNNSASNNNSSRQPFTDLQQVQLRAQIFVYGSLIQGTAPDEACMVSAFGSSDGRSVWEPVWRAAVERVRSQKSNSSAAETPLHSHTVTRASDVKQGSGSSMAASSSPVGRASSKGTPATVVNPIMPLSSPLWSISTPSRDNFPLNSTTHKGPVVDYQHAISPLHSFQTPPIRNFVGHTLWPSQPCFPCPWLASPQSSAFNTSGHFQPVTMTETVKYTSEPLTSSVKHVSSSPPVQSVTPSPVHVGASLLPDSKTAASAKGHSVNSKSRKRKKNQSSNSAQISLLSEARTEPAVDSNIAFVPSQSITVLASSASDTVPSKMASPVSAICLVDQPKKGNLDTREVATCAVETLGEVAEAKSHADDAAALAAALAAATVSHNEHLWRQLTKQKVSELTSEVEAKLASAAAAISVAASVAKAAAAAAKVACSIALQAKLMADEASNIDNTSDLVPSSDIGSATPASKAATAASKQAENMDAIAKAVELATAAVSQAGKIVAMGEPLPLSDLIEAGSEGFWSRPFDSAVKLEVFNKEQFGVKNRDETPSKGSKKDSGMTVDHSEIPPGVGTDDGLANGIERSVHASEILQSGKEFKMFDNAELCEMGSEPLDVAVVENNCGESVGAFSRDGIREGSAVEVYKCGDGQKSAWFSAIVLALEHGKAYVRYADLPSEEGSGNLCEWVQLEGEGDEAPVIRTARPLTALQYQGTRKRRRAALGDYAWSIGDRVDVWIDDRWWEGVVTEKNEKDATTLKVNFPAHGETSTVKSWNLRMSRLWKDGKWVEWSSTKGHNVSEQSDTPKEKRQRRGSLTVLAKGKDKLSNDAVPALGKPEQSKLLDLSVSETKFDIGKITKEENKRVAHRPLRSGQPKEGSRVVFGVPKPTGKKRKFMEVSKQFPPNNSEKKNEATNSVKFAKFLKPQSRSDSKGKQTLRSTLRQRNNLNPTSARNVNLKGNGKGTQDCVDHHAEEVMEKSANDSSAPGELVEAPLSSLVAQTLSSSMKKVSSFNFKSEPLNRGKPVSSVGKLSKIEEEDKEAAEPRRSNRRIQPTHRLLEGLQSSIMIPKMPAVSLQSCQRKPNSRNVVTKGK